MKITVAEALREGNWSYLPWSPRIADDAAFQEFVEVLAERAAAYVEWRVGAHYADTAEPKASVLKEAEMHLCQEQIMLSAAEVADAAAGGGTAPFLASGAELREQARHRRERAEELLAAYNQVPPPGYALAAIRTGLGAEALADYRFDEILGQVEGE